MDWKCLLQICSWWYISRPLINPTDHECMCNCAIALLCLAHCVHLCVYCVCALCALHLWMCGTLCSAPQLKLDKVWNVLIASTPCCPCMAQLPGMMLTNNINIKPFSFYFLTFGDKWLSPKKSPQYQQQKCLLMGLICLSVIPLFKQNGRIWYVLP